MTIDIPSSLSLITLRQFLAYHIAADDAEKVMVITGLDEEQVKSLPMERVTDIIQIFETALAMTPDKFETIVKLDKLMTVGFIPDLTDMTLREHIALDNLSKEIWADPDKADYRSLPKLLAVLFRPITARVGSYYSIEKYHVTTAKKHMQYFDALTMDVVNSALLFFSTIAKELRVSSNAYLLARLEDKVKILRHLQRMEA